MKRDVIDTLSRHFRCLEQEVTCARVRPFLAGLLLSAEPVRIPTPITVHLDHCPQCTDDFQALADLGLTDEQLERLERFYGHTAASSASVLSSSSLASFSATMLHSSRHRLAEKWLCRRARARIPRFAEGGLDEIEGEILDHLCTCPTCRARVHEARRSLLDNPGETPAPREERYPAVCGEVVPTAELFDYVVPYGWTGPATPPAAEESCRPTPPGCEGTGPEDAETRDGETASEHLRPCRACLGRIQELADLLYGIAERANSGVATTYRTVDPDTLSQAAGVPRGVVRDTSGGAPPHPSDAPRTTTPADLATWYAQFPIRVQVLRRPPEPAAAEAIRLRPAFRPQVRFLLKTAVAAAAVVPLAFLVLSTNRASGITLAQMFRALGKAENVYVAKFFAPTGQLVAERWISRPANLVLAARGQERSLYDLRSKKKYIYSASEAPAEAADLSEREYAVVRRLMDACLGFALKDIPPTAEWTRVNDTEDVDTYQLTFAEKTPPGTAVLDKYEIVVDPITGHPRELRVFSRASAGEDWQCEARTEIRYLTPEEMKAVLEAQPVPGQR